MKSLLLLALLAGAALPADQTYVGWASDSGCARARASVGKFTATNPDCARQCVKHGKSIVLISQEHKTVFAIDNPQILQAHVGNKVSISASPAGQHSLHISKVISSEESNPECERPKLKEWRPVSTNDVALGESLPAPNPLITVDESVQRTSTLITGRTASKGPPDAMRGKASEGRLIIARRFNAGISTPLRIACRRHV